MFCKEVLLVLTTILIASTSGARILAYIPIPSYSHQIVFQPLWRELSLRGHQVVLLTTDPIGDETLTNLTEIDLGFTYKEFKEHINDLIYSNDNLWKAITNLIEGLYKLTDEQLGHPQVQALIKSDTEKFDLLIVEYALAATFAFAHKFKCPFIGVSSMDASTLLLKSFGNPVHPVLYPDLLLPFEGDLTLLQRVISSSFYVVMSIISHYHVLPLQDTLVAKHFNSDYPASANFIGNASMAFVNSDPIFHQVKPLVPGIIQIGGGIHAKSVSTKPLPKELRKELDDATQGFIYFSLGSNVKSKDIDNATRDVILDTFAELPYKILWKYEIEELGNKPSNVITSKWLPQQEILKHANIKLFITQGGLQSTDEAIYNHVPMVGMPFFADQPSNMKKMVSSGFGLSVDHKTLNKEEFKSTILEVINNPKYRNKIKELADLAQDQPMTGLERAIWWTEYVIRHKGAKHLRSPALDIPWYQYFLLDVIGVLLLALIVIICIAVLLGRLLIKLFKCIFRRERKLKKN